MIFFRYLIYAQGLPLVINLIVLIVDKVGQPGSCASNPFLNDVITNLVEDIGDDGMLSPETNLQNQTVGQSYIDTEKYQRYLPNMGIYGCFLSNGLDGIGKSYFSNPVFIYFQSIMLVKCNLNFFKFYYEIFCFLDNARHKYVLPWVHHAHH